MTRVLKFLVILLVLLVAVFFLGAPLLPDRVQVTREVDIGRPAIQVFAVVNDLGHFNDWSPWYDLDPDAHYRLEGPERGEGATLHWAGNDAVGSGRLRIVESQAPVRVRMEVGFDGFPVPAQSILQIDALDDGSCVSWSFETRLEGAVARWFGLLMPRWIGTDYDKGLARLRVLLESQPEPDFGDLRVEEGTVDGMDVIVTTTDEAAQDDPAANAGVLGGMYGRLLAFAAAGGLEIAGHPLTFTDDPAVTPWRFRAALPVRFAAGVAPEDGVELVRVPGGRALFLEHVGPHEGLAAAMAKLDAWAVAHGLRRGGPVRAVYISDPAETPAEELVTRIIYPLAE